MTDAHKSALQRIHDAGFPYLKVEFEAQFNRLDASVPYDCDCGEGPEDCSDCAERQAWEQRRTLAPAVLDLDFSDDRVVTRWLHNQLSPTIRRQIAFSLFYNDGSVDSELTITIPTLKAESFVRVCEVFGSLQHAIGNGIDTRGAGMHIAVLQAKDYREQPGLDSARLNNFTRQVTKLLPALYFLASPDRFSRDLSYRQPSIASEKYSAISTRGGRVFEFRVFETCYNKPEHLLDNFEVIANCLEFYADPGKVANIDYRGSYGLKPQGQNVNRFFDTAQKLLVMEEGLKYLKPKDKPISQLKRERGNRVTRREITEELKNPNAKVEKEWQELKERWEHIHAPRFREMVDKLLRESVVVKINEESYLRWCIDRGLIDPQPPTKAQYVKEHAPANQHYGYAIRMGN
jgi:hypothetical protein